MKREMMVLVLVWGLLASIGLARGADVTTAVVDGQGTDRVHLRESPSALPPSEGYQMLVYSQSPNPKSSIRIQYPWFTGAGADALNAMVYAKVLSFVEEPYAVYSDGTGLTIDYQAAVTLQNGKIVSIIFWGSSYVEGGIHPYTDLVALNVDLSTMKEISLTDLYAIGADFERVFFDRAFFPTNPITSYDAASFPEMLRLQTPEYQTVSPFDLPGSVSCFLKPDGIVLSMASVHATGSDHFEAQLRYEEIQRFYRLGQNYWEN